MNQSLPLFAFISVFLLFFGTLDQSRGQEKADPLHLSTELIPSRLEPSQTGELKIHLEVETGFKVYADQIKLEAISPQGFLIGKLQITPTKKFLDKFSNREREGIFGKALLKAAIEAPTKIPEDAKQLVLQFTYQACTETYCLFPEKKKIEISLDPARPESLKGLSPEDKGWSLNSKFSDIVRKGSFVTYLFVFIFGLLTSLTPCIFPMIPITLAVLGRNAHRHTRAENVLVSSIYVLGMALTYALLGLLAASSGALFGSFMNHPVVLSIVCLVFAIMAFSELGFYDLEPPRWIRDSKVAQVTVHGRSGAFFMGVISGLIASPCVGPVLVGILTYVAQTKDLVFGFTLLFVYALGIGVLFIALGLSTQLRKKLPHSGPWMDTVKRLLGFMLLGGAFYYLQFLIPARAWNSVLGLTLVVLAIYFGAFRRTQNRWLRIMLTAFLAIGVLHLSIGIFDVKTFGPKIHSPTGDSTAVSAITWKVYSEDLLQKAKQDKKKVIIDFAADWCAACHELDEKTFSHPDFIKATQGFELLKFDATDDSPALQELKTRYEIVGLPTVVFINANGQWMKELTLTEFESIENFLKRLEKL